MLTTQTLAPHAIVEHIGIKNYPYLPRNYYLNLALMYAQKGFYVFPVNPNKFPYKGFSWNELATNNPEEIRALWQKYPNGRPAVYGKRSSLLIIDIDNKPMEGKNGFQVFNELIEKLGKPAKTVVVYSQSNGAHLYYKLPENRQFRRKIDNCIDVQVNHYCICGGVYTKKGSYRFAKGFTFEDIGEIPELSPQWVEFLSKPNEKQKFKNSYKNTSQEQTEFDGDFQEVYDDCPFIKSCVDNAEILDENSWFKFAVVVSKLKNGLEIFDQYSRPHPDYCPEKVRAKFENAKKYNINCKTIAVDFDGCKQCKYYKQGE